MWQRGPAHLYRQTRCCLTQIDHQLGSKSFRCRFTITLALRCSADHQRQIDVQSLSEGAGYRGALGEAKQVASVLFMDSLPRKIKVSHLSDLDWENY